MNFERAAAGHDVTATDLRRVLGVGLSGRRVTDLSALPGDGPNAVFAVTTGDGKRYVLKCATGEREVADLRRELSVTNYVRWRTDVPVVEPLSYGFEESGLPTSYVVFPWATGTTLDDAIATLPPHARPGLFSNVGETLARLHEQTSFDAAGDVVPAGPESVEIDPANGWPELFARRLADRVEALRGTRFETVAEEVWSYVGDRLRELEAGESAVLLHGDVGDGNVVYDGTSVSAVLDWERAFVGHPEYDLCRAEARYFLNDWGQPSRFQALLYSGYRSVRDLPDGFDARRRCYLATFFLLPLSTYPEWGPTATDDLDGFAERLAEKVRDVMDD